MHDKNFKGEGGGKSNLIDGGAEWVIFFLIIKGIIDGIIAILKPILEPVNVDYPVNLLADQIYGISIMLFILSILISILILALLINMVIIVYSDKLLNLFTNKYIRWYII